MPRYRLVGPSGQRSSGHFWGSGGGGDLAEGVEAVQGSLTVEVVFRVVGGMARAWGFLPLMGSSMDDNFHRRPRPFQPPLEYPESG